MRALLITTAVLIAAPALAQNAETEFWGGPPEVPSYEPAFDDQWRAPIAESDVEIEQETVADGLVFPWAMEQLPDGRLLVTEKAGRMRVVSMDGTVSEPIAGLPEMVTTDQGGLLDVKLAPDFPQTRELFFTFSQPREDGKNATAVARARLGEDAAALEDVQVIFQQQPAWDSTKHFGSRIVFEDVDTMWIGLGERSLPEPRELAQRIDNHIGKIVRIDRDGSVPQDNPFAEGPQGAAPEIWSYGHRNIQAMARHPGSGRLWSIEHGPQGGDEVNVPEPGMNYGWPVVSYGEEYGGGFIGEGAPRMEGMQEPAYYWSPVIAPSGAAFYEGDMFADWEGDLLVGGLVLKGLVRLELDGERVAAEDRLVRGVGRVRDVLVAEDGAILLAIDAEDGRIVRLTPKGGA
jgi:glucose/arabinose dehydrogenase